MYSIGFPMNENQLGMQGSTPPGSRHCGGWFSTKVRPRWGPCSGPCLLETNPKYIVYSKYDGPFHFQNGIAEVKYYGQKRKINEKGELVK
jgi:hypothetical protein